MKQSQKMQADVMLAMLGQTKKEALRTDETITHLQVGWTQRYAAKYRRLFETDKGFQQDVLNGDIHAVVERLEAHLEDDMPDSRSS